MAAYSNFRAGRALVTASLQAILRSPSAVVFGFAFPMVFILVFGLLGGGGGGFSTTLSLAPGSDTTNPIYGGLKSMSGIKWRYYPDTAAQMADLRKDEISAIMRIEREPLGTIPAYKVKLQAASTDMGEVQQLQSVIHGLIKHQASKISRRL